MEQPEGRQPGVPAEASTTPADASSAPSLRRVLSLPLLVLYGLGTTIGAGIYALTGKIAGLAGPCGDVLVNAKSGRGGLRRSCRRYRGAAGDLDQSSGPLSRSATTRDSLSHASRV